MTAWREELVEGYANAIAACTLACEDYEGGGDQMADFIVTLDHTQARCALVAATSLAVSIAHIVEQLAHPSLGLTAEKVISDFGVEGQIRLHNYLEGGD